MRKGCANPSHPPLWRGSEWSTDSIASKWQAGWLPATQDSFAAWPTPEEGVFPLSLWLKSSRNNSDMRNSFAVQMGSELSKPHGVDASRERGFFHQRGKEDEEAKATTLSCAKNCLGQGIQWWAKHTSLLSRSISALFSISQLTRNCNEVRLCFDRGNIVCYGYIM